MKVPFNLIKITYSEVNKCWSVGFDFKFADESKRCVIIFTSEQDAINWVNDYQADKVELPTIDDSAYTKVSDYTVDQPVHIYKLKED